MVYYLPGTTGWSVFSADTGLTPVPWNPLIQASGTNFGVGSNDFGFNITGTTNIPIVVEASTDLASPVWTSLQTNTLANGSFDFSDPQWTNYAERYYRIATLGSVSLMDQSSANVYSQNVVGYINETVPAGGFAIISCPLVVSPDNTLNTLFSNIVGTYSKVRVCIYSPESGYAIFTGTQTSWGHESETGGDAGTNTLNPGQAAFIQNTLATPLTLTFVGSVVSGVPRTPWFRTASTW